MIADHRISAGRAGLVAAGVLAAALSLSACGGSSAAGTSNPKPAGSSSPAAATGRVGGPAASGLIAAVSGTTMQVQNQQSGQVAVRWSATTTFSHTVTTTLSAIRVGSCVIAVGGSGTSQSAASFAATTVTVSAAVNGTCTGGFGGPRAGDRPSGLPGGQRPTGFPTGSGQPRREVGAVASGKVTAVSGSTLTIAARTFGSSGTTAKTVTVGASTKIRTQASTTAASVVVGKCATAQGKADTTGTVAATRVEISDATNGQCGFGGFGVGGSGG